ncbi:MAG TPA: LptF/LptG family permease, partial [Polyangiaceae bacterium]|nr:LptF/LptG family permease [Polyangiaceae bacterium]
MKILNRYVLKEHAGPLTFATTALTSLLLLDYIAKNIGQLVGKGLPWTVIAEFIGLSVPFTIAMTLPMAVLVSVLYAFSRLAAENEITALKASGVSLGRILVPVVIGAIGLTIFMVLFNDQVLPRANHRLRTLQGDIARKKPTFGLRARVLNEVSPGKLFLIANHLDAGSNRMREVVIYDLGDPTRERTIYADSGTMAMVPETGDLLMTLFDGNMDELKKAELSELQRLYYKVDHIRVKGVGDQLTRSTNDDYKSEREMTICEMQADVADGAKTRAEARALAQRALVNAVHTATTGQTPPPVPDLSGKLPASETRAPFGMGRAYCEAEASLLR